MTDDLCRRLARGLWVIFGLAWFVWLGYEDRGVHLVLGLAALAALAIGTTATVRWIRRRSNRLTIPRWLGFAATGLLGGAAVGPLAAVLILVKVSLHAHPVLDFSRADLVEVLSRTPAWALSGLLVGLAACLVAAGERAEEGRRARVADQGE